MPLESTSFLNILIDTGADTALNLFDVNFLFTETNTSNIPKMLGYRTTMFTPPATTVSTTDVPYINTNIKVVTPGVSIDREVRLQIRADSNYDILSFLRGHFGVDEDGNVDRSITQSCDITVIGYTYRGQEPLLYQAYAWEFKECYLTTLTPLTFTYDGGQGIYQATFIYKSYRENQISDN